MNAISRDSNSLAQQLGRFLVIGLSSVFIDLLGYHALLQANWEPSLAKGLSYVLGMIWGYFGNKLWTFRVETLSAVEPLIYLLLYATTLGINVGINTSVLAAIKPESKLLAFGLATATSTVLNFLGMKFIAFRQRDLSKS